MSSRKFENSIPYLDVEGVEKGMISQYADNYSSVISTQNDIFALRTGSRNGLILKGQHGAVGSTFFCLTPILIERDYLFYFLKSIEFIHSGTRDLNNSFWDLEVPLAPLEEQKRIVEALELKLKEYQKDFENAQNELNKISEYNNNILEQAISGKLTEAWRKTNFNLIDIDNFIKDRYLYYKSFGESEKYKIPDFEANNYSNKPINWIATTIESASVFIIDCLHSTPRFKDKGKFCIDTNSIEPFKINWNKVRKISYEDYFDRINRLKPIGGDIVFSREGTIGIVVVLPNDIDICLGQRVMIIRFPAQIHPTYAAIYLQSPFFKTIYNKYIFGASAKHLNIKDIRKLLFLIPPYIEQVEIVRAVEVQLKKIEELKNKYSESIEGLTKLQQSIFQLAFIGRLSTFYVEDDSISNLLEKIKKEKEIVEKAQKEFQKLKIKTFNNMNKNTHISKSIIEILKDAENYSLTIEEIWQNTKYFKLWDKDGYEKFYKELQPLIDDKKIIEHRSNDGMVITLSLLANEN